MRLIQKNVSPHFSLAKCKFVYYFKDYSIALDSILTYLFLEGKLQPCLKLRNILETLYKNYPKFVLMCSKFMTVRVLDLSILGLVMQEFLKDYENLQNGNFLKTLLMNIS